MAEKKGILSQFKQFLLRGNVVDLAVAVVIGTAFGAVVKALVSDILTPLIGIPGKADFSTFKFTIHGSHFLYGDLINNVISFLSVAAAVFFFVVKPINALTSRLKRGTPEPVAKKTKDCPYCLTAIPLEATKCSACTSTVDPVPAT
ncbi:MAG TPA: large conductance mechanosensitive channel protein MscL [Actinomycetota bacterium]|nr:large conductance mechanosensitive channel protein MscL [Actinomycetota bacterium]